MPSYRIYLRPEGKVIGEQQGRANQKRKKSDERKKESEKDNKRLDVSSIEQNGKEKYKNIRMFTAKEQKKNK